MGPTCLKTWPNQKRSRYWSFGELCGCIVCGDSDDSGVCRLWWILLVFLLLSCGVDCSVVILIVRLVVLSIGVLVVL